MRGITAICGGVLAWMIITAALDPLPDWGRIVALGVATFWVAIFHIAAVIESLKEGSEDA